MSFYRQPAMRVATIAFAVAMACGLFATTSVATQRGEYPAEEMQQHNFDVNDGGTLRIDVDDADVAVGTSTAGAAEVTISLRSNDMEWARDRFERTNYRARLDGNTVVVESDAEPRGSWVSGNWMSVLVDVRVPTRFDLDVATQDGDIDAGSFEGDALLRSQDGDVTVGTLDGARIELRTQDGDVRASRLAGEDLVVHTQDGHIDVDTVRGAIAAHTSDGDIRIGSADAPEIDLETSDGDIHVATAGPGRMRLDSNDGDISIEAPASLPAEIDLRGEEVYLSGIGSLDGDVFEGRARGSINGGGETITARTGDGDVRLIGRQ